MPKYQHSSHSVMQLVTGIKKLSSTGTIRGQSNSETAATAEATIETAEMKPRGAVEVLRTYCVTAQQARNMKNVPASDLPFRSCKTLTPCKQK